MEEVKLGVKPTTNGEPPVETGSIVARLREQARVQSEAKRLDIKVGGEFKDHLWIRYRPLPPNEMDTFIARGMAKGTNIMEFESDTYDMMARCCVEIIGRYGDEEAVLADADGPVKLEHRLAVLLDMPRPEGVKLTSHEVIPLLFGNNGPLLGTHASKLMTWMTGTEGEEEPGE